MEISLDEILKSINFEKYNKSVMMALAEFYTPFPNKLAPALADVYNSWGKLGTMSVTSGTGIMSAKYKKGD